MKKKKLKRREEKEENNKKKRSKRKKRKNRKKLGRMVPVHFDPKGSAKLRWVGQGQGTSYFIPSVVQWKEKSP